VALPGVGGGRFGRMFPHLPRRDPGLPALDALAAALLGREGSDPNESIPAGYTYLGQFIDHDLTFDPASQLQRDNDPEALIDFRTPRLDLDSVYGAGPDDQPYLYDWADERDPGVRMLLGPGPDRPAGTAAVDLPRNQAGRALIGDARNDENALVAQLHLLFLRFHNQVVEHLREQERAPTGRDLLEDAQREVRWHYQWIVRHEFLPLVTGDTLEHFERRFFRWSGDQPFMPVEFSAAAFRFGHSMVRQNYVLRRGTPPVDILPGLRGRRPLPEDLVLEWRQFFPLPDERRPLGSMRIDTRLAGALRHVPPTGLPLAQLNLERSQALGLPSGTDVAHAIGETALTDGELALGDVVDAEAREALLRAPPLWYYVLRETDRPGNAGTHLGPVGARLVAEVLIGLLEGDPQSYVNQYPEWEPTLGEHQGRFDMPDLIGFTERGEHDRT
jgi:hypothetical protein